MGPSIAREAATMLNVVEQIDVQTALVFLAVLLAVLAYHSTRLPSGFPPGPRPWPIIGNLDILAKDPQHSYKTLAELKGKYGEVVGMKMGSHKTVLLNGLTAIRESLVKQADTFSYRPAFMHVLTKVFTFDGSRRGIVWTDGDVWRESRRFALTALRDFGFGKRSLEMRIQEEASIMCDEIAKVAGKPFDISVLAQEAVANVICSLCFGNRFDYTDPKFQKILYLLNEGMSQGVSSSVINFIPSLRFLPTQSWYKRAINTMHNIDNYIDDQIEHHRVGYDPNHNIIRDFVDLYLQEQEGHGNEATFSASNIRRVIFDLFASGTETTSTALRWFLLYMMHYPEVQRRCQHELDTIIGSSRQVSLADRPALPYVDATIHELLRITNVVPFAAPHMNDKETTLCGFTIPARTMIFVNLYAVNMDPELWEDPESFKPERWLTSSGTFEKKDAFIPFSAGPRACMGEAMARNETFLFFSFMLQRFTFKTVDSKNPPPLAGNMGITLAPYRYKLIAEPR